MNPKYYLFTLLLGAISCLSLKAEDQKPQAQKPAICPTENPCRDLNNSCTCYCSRECGPRDKKKDEDEPVFVPDDPHGNFCYCKPWDRDNFEKRCKAQKDAKENKENLDKK